MTARKNKAKANTVTSVLFFMVCMGILGLVAYQSYFAKRVRFKEFKEFGIPIPVNFSVHGIDVSHHNGTINWAMVKQMNVRGVKLDFAFVKATQGISFVDDQFAANWRGAKKNNVYRGAYHYFTEQASGEEQARHFIATVGNLLPGDMPPVLDIEENKFWSLQKLNEEALKFIQYLEKYYNIKPIVYTYTSFYNDKLSKAFEPYPFWVAQYKDKSPPNVDRNWMMWQHSEKGQVSGVNDDVDFNVFKGDMFLFKQLLK